MLESQRPLIDRNIDMSSEQLLFGATLETAKNSLTVKVKQDANKENEICEKEA